MMFFNPDDEFVEWIKEYANGRMIIEVGLGDGDLAKALVKKGCYVIGLDPFWDTDNFDSNVFFNVLPQEAQHSTIVTNAPPSSLILVTRPCHNTWVYETIQAKPNNVEFLYIGLERNIEIDLGDIPYTIVKHEGISQDNEVVLSIW